MLKFLKYVITICLSMFLLNVYWANSDFAITKIDVMSSNKLNLVFNYSLESSDWAVRDFKIINKSDDLDIVNILSNKLISSNTLEITLDKNLSISTDYELNVISIKDDKLNSITKWINWIIAFKTPSEFPIISENSTNKFAETNTWTNQINTQSGENNQVLPLNSAQEEKINISSASREQPMTWNTNNITEQAKTTEKLPKTWAEEMLLLILSLILWTLFFVIKAKKA